MAARKTKITPNSIKKPSGLKKDGTPNAPWQKFQKKLKAFNDTPINEWNEVNILGYLLSKYEKQYQIDFGLSYSGPPSKCSEIYCVKRMMTTIGTEKGSICKDYIDWVFETHITPKGKEIVSLAYFFNKGIIAQYRTIFKDRQKVTKTTALPNEYAAEANSLGLSINTYGDLAFAKMAVDQSPDDYPEYSSLFIRLSAAGFNESVLRTLE